MEEGVHCFGDGDGELRSTGSMWLLNVEVLLETQSCLALDEAIIRKLRVAPQAVSIPASWPAVNTTHLRDKFQLDRAHRVTVKVHDAAAPELVLETSAIRPARQDVEEEDVEEADSRSWRAPYPVEPHERSAFRLGSLLNRTSPHGRYSARNLYMLPAIGGWHRDLEGVKSAHGALSQGSAFVLNEHHVVEHSEQKQRNRDSGCEEVRVGGQRGFYISVAEAPQYVARVARRAVACLSSKRTRAIGPGDQCNAAAKAATT